MEENQEIKGQALESDNIELEGYGKRTYKKVQKLRKKALQYGIDVPKCTHPLTRPTRPRPLMLLGKWVCLGCAGLLVGLTILLFVKLHYFKAFAQIFDVMRGTLDAKAVALTLGFSGIATATLFVVLLIMLAMAIIPIAFVILFANQACEFGELAHAPRQQIAVGYKIKSQIRLVSVLAILDLILTIFIIVKSKNSADWLIILILLVIFAVLVFYAVALKITQRKEKEWFGTLSVDAQNDYINHDKALEAFANKRKRKAYMSSRRK